MRQKVPETGRVEVGNVIYRYPNPEFSGYTLSGFKSDSKATELECMRVHIC